MSAFLTSLKDRKVIQWTVAYVAMAWVVAQVAEVVAGPWGISMAWVRLLHVVLVAGLPLVLTLAWYHGDRGQQRVQRSEVLVLVLILAGTLMAIRIVPLEEEPAAAEVAQSSAPASLLLDIPPETPRLAVLAFSNLGAAADAFFADGLTAELGSRLSGLRGLALLSPSSAKTYRGSEKTPREFGRDLGADYVLSGTVLWDRNAAGETSVRVIPEVTRVADNTQVWTERLDRSFEDAVTLQAQIALQVANSLEVTLSAPEREEIGDGPTANPLAYETYLKGIKVLPEGHGAEADYRQARVLLEQATTLDPQFLEAWTALAEADFGLYWFGYDTRPDRLQAGLNSVRKALDIDPDSAEAHIALGDYHYRRREWDEALKQFSRAYQERPNDAYLLMRLGYLWRRQGLVAQGLEALERSSALDPLNSYTLVDLAWTHLNLGHVEVAREFNERARTINPDEDWAYLVGVIICWTAGGPEALDCSRQELEEFPDPISPYPAWFWLLQLQFEGKTAAALTMIENFPEPALVLQSIYLPVELVKGQLLLELGRDLEGRQLLQEAVSKLGQLQEQNPTDERLHLALGLAYASLGQPDKAGASARQALAILPPQMDIFRGADVMYVAAEIYALIGEDQEALDLMARHLSMPSVYRATWWTHPPAFQHLRDNPRFIDLVGQGAAEPGSQPESRNGANRPPSD